MKGRSDILTMPATPAGGRSRRSGSGDRKEPGGIAFVTLCRAGRRPVHLPEVS